MLVVCQQITEATSVPDIGKFLANKHFATKLIVSKQAFTVRCIPQRLPRILQRLRDCGIRLHWY